MQFIIALDSPLMCMCRKCTSAAHHSHLETPDRAQPLSLSSVRQQGETQTHKQVKLTFSIKLPTRKQLRGIWIRSYFPDGACRLRFHWGDLIVKGVVIIYYFCICYGYYCDHQSIHPPPQFTHCLIGNHFERGWFRN